MLVQILYIFITFSHTETDLHMNKVWKVIFAVYFSVIYVQQ